MIAKAVKGAGFGGALRYDLEKEKAALLDTNLTAHTPKEMAREFGTIRKLRPNLKKAVCHVSLSAAPGEKLSDDQWRTIGERYLTGMGFLNNQYVMTRHHDTEHEHVHLVINRISHDGSVVTDSQDYKRQEIIMRQIEQDYGLRQVQNSSDSLRRAPTQKELELALRTGKASNRQILQALCDEAMSDCANISQYAERLAVAGVKIIPTLQQEDRKLSGLIYLMPDGKSRLKGSDLGKVYSPAGLAKKGVTYEKDRDFNAIKRLSYREHTTGLNEQARDLSPKRIPESRRVFADSSSPDGSDISLNDRIPDSLSKKSEPSGSFPGKSRESGERISKQKPAATPVDRSTGQGGNTNVLEGLGNSWAGRGLLLRAYNLIINTAVREIKDFTNYPMLAKIKARRDRKAALAQSAQKETNHDSNPAQEHIKQKAQTPPAKTQTQNHGGGGGGGMTFGR